MAIERYVELAYGAARGSASLDEIQNGARRRAGTISEPISSLATSSDASAAGYRGAYALSIIASELLTERAGEPALLDYFRHLPTADGWEAAFEAAFGIATDDFHVEFEAYRSEVAPPLPHLTDDVDEPSWSARG